MQEMGFKPWLGKIPWRREGLPTLVFLHGNPMDRGGWQAIVHGVTKVSDTTERLDNSNNNQLIMT